MIVEIAVATHTSPAAWWGETDEVIATVIDVLTEQAEQLKSKGKSKRK